MREDDGKRKCEYGMLKKKVEKMKRLKDCPSKQGTWRFRLTGYEYSMQIGHEEKSLEVEGGLQVL